MTAFLCEKMVNGTLTGLPETVTAGELVKWKWIPRRQQEMLKEGEDYTWNWDEKKHLRLRHEETKRQQKLLQPEPMETYETGWKLR